MDTNKQRRIPVAFRVLPETAEALDALANEYRISKTALFELLVAREEETRSTKRWSEEKENGD